jgi:Domain of unknown function DUF11
MVFRREGPYALVAVLVALVVAGLLFAGSAWSADKNGDSKKDRKDSRQEKRTQSSSTRTESNRATQNPRQSQQVGTQQVGTQDVDTGGGVTLSKVDDPDPVEVNGLLLYTIELTNDSAGANRDFDVVDTLPDEVDYIVAAVDEEGFTGDCEETSGEVTCSIIDLDEGETATIQILVEPQETGTITNFADVCDAVADPDCNDPLASVDEDTRVVNDLNRDNRQDRRDRFRDFLRDNPFFQDNPFFDQYDDLSQEEQYLDAENDLDGETTDDEFTTSDDDGDGVSANSGDGVAEASTPNAVARSGDPDESDPVSGPQGDVVDEIPTEGELPYTGGPSLWVYAMAGAGGLLFLAALARRIRRG